MTKREREGKRKRKRTTSSSNSNSRVQQLPFPPPLAPVAPPPVNSMGPCRLCKYFQSGCKGCVLSGLYPYQVGKLIEIFGTLDNVRNMASQVPDNQLQTWFHYRFVEADAYINDSDRVNGAGKVLEVQKEEIYDLNRQVYQLSKEKYYLQTVCDVLRLQGEKALEVLRSQGIDPFEMILLSEGSDVAPLEKVQKKSAGDVNAVQTEVAGDVNGATGGGMQDQVMVDGMQDLVAEATVQTEVADAAVQTEVADAAV